MNKIFIRWVKCPRSEKHYIFPPNNLDTISLITTIQWTKEHGPRLTENLNSGKCCSLRSSDATVDMRQCPCIKKNTQKRLPCQCNTLQYRFSESRLFEVTFRSNTVYSVIVLLLYFRWGVRFSAAVQTGPAAHPASFTMGIGSLCRG